MRSRTIFQFILITLTTLLVNIQATSADQARADTVTYYHYDGLGSIIAATDQSGALLWHEDYLPYGKRITREDDDRNTLWFTGKPHDDSIGLSYFGARWYDPAIGRFTSIDPVDVDPENLHSFNRYAYANNNPYRYVDPDGESPIDAVFLAADAVNLAVAIYNGAGIGAAAADFGASAVGLVSPIPGTGQAIKAARLAGKAAKNRVFWSGGNKAHEAAERYAQSTGGKTLEMTFTGRVLDKVTNDKTLKYLAPLWKAASKRFAKGAKGQANVFQPARGVRIKSVWAKTEYPVLKRNNVDIKYHIGE